MSHEVVAGLIIHSQKGSQKVLLVQRALSQEFYPGVWDLFGGHMEPGEGQEETLARELEEELTVHLYLVTV